MRFLFGRGCLARTGRASPLLSPQTRYTLSTFTRSTAREGVNARSKRQWGDWRKDPPNFALGREVAARLHGLDKRESTVLITPKKDRQAKSAYSIFRKLALAQLDELMLRDGWAGEKKTDYTAFGVSSKLDFDHQAKLFRSTITKACDYASSDNATSRKLNPLFWSLRNAFITADLGGLLAELKYRFQSFLMRSRFPENILATHKTIADMRYPYEWFPATRAIRRTIHLHVGPTNSGKTYSALQALENAKSGIYAGPLRLLAHEVYTRFIAKGKPCALVTGEEQRIPEGIDTYFRSCTVEMAPVNSLVDVAVIDEIQMIGDAERGWAWSQAFLGVQAKELHLCGEERVVDLIQSLCASIGDECIIHRYKRLSGLETMSQSFGTNLKNLEKGDAIISFSRIGIHSLKKQVEHATGKRCAIVYGSLPPETRAQQAALFNDPDNDFDFLVASDAIGMGLNLEIRRVIFEATHKRDNITFRKMSISELKQIGGRAGRFRSANHAIQSATGTGEPLAPVPRGPGLVTALEDEDLANVIEAFRSDAEPMETAGLQPPMMCIERMSTYFPPNTPLSFIILRLREIAALSPRYHMCTVKDMVTIADLIQPYPMSIYDRCVFLNAPAAVRDPSGAVTLQALAACVSRMEGGDLLDIPQIKLELLDSEYDPMKEKHSDYLSKLEGLHKSLTLYLWLSYRFSGVFVSQALAFHVKGLLEAKIDEQLAGLAVSEVSRKKRMEVIRKLAKAQVKKQRLLEETMDADIDADIDADKNAV